MVLQLDRGRNPQNQCSLLRFCHRVASYPRQTRPPHILTLVQLLAQTRRGDGQEKAVQETRSDFGASIGFILVIVKLHFRSMARKKNIVGPQVRNLRYQQGISQEMLAARCARYGWDISRGTLSKIEAQVRCVIDSELVILADALGVKLDQLFPPARLGRK